MITTIKNVILTVTLMYVRDHIKKYVAPMWFYWEVLPTNKLSHSASCYVPSWLGRSPRQVVSEWSIVCAVVSGDC